MKILKKIIQKDKQPSKKDIHQKDVKIEQQLSEFALTEIELRDR